MAAVTATAHAASHFLMGMVWFLFSCYWESLHSSKGCSANHSVITLEKISFPTRAADSGAPRDVEEPAGRGQRPGGLGYTAGGRARIGRACAWPMKLPSLPRIDLLDP